MLLYLYLIESSDDDDDGVNVSIEVDEDEDGEEEEDEEDDEEDDEETLDDDDCEEFAKNMREEPGSDSGCTAVVALLKGTELYVANAGDSRCILCRDGNNTNLINNNNNKY